MAGLQSSSFLPFEMNKTRKNEQTNQFGKLDYPVRQNDEGPIATKQSQIFHCNKMLRASITMACACILKVKIFQCDNGFSNLVLTGYAKSRGLHLQQTNQRQWGPEPQNRTRKV